MRAILLAAMFAVFAPGAVGQTWPVPPGAPPEGAQDIETPQQVEARHAALLERYDAALSVCQAVMAGHAPAEAAALHGFTSTEPVRVGVMTLNDIRLAEANHLGMEAVIHRSEEVAVQARLRIFAAENMRRCIVEALGPVDFSTRADLFTAGWTRHTQSRGPDPESPDWHQIWEVSLSDAAGDPVRIVGRRAFNGFGRQTVFFGESAEAIPRDSETPKGD